MKLSVFLEDELSIAPGSLKLSIKSQLEKYRDKYDALIAKKKIHTDVYKVMPSGKIIAWFKIPSQSLDKFYYDVLLELTPSDGAKKFEDCEVKFFSNSPSFVYGGYAYIFHHLDSDPRAPDGKGMMIDMYRSKVPRDNLLIPRSESKLGEEAVTEEPVVRNRLGIPMPDFSIYCAIFHMIDNMSFRSVLRTRNYRTVNQMVSTVRSFDQLMLERKREENREKQTKERKHRQEVKEVKEVVKKHAAGSMKSANRVQSAKSTSRAKSTATNRGRSGGVNRIG